MASYKHISGMMSNGPPVCPPRPEAPATAVKLTSASRHRLTLALRSDTWVGESVSCPQGSTETSLYSVKSIGKPCESMIFFAGLEVGIGSFASAISLMLSLLLICGSDPEVGHWGSDEHVA